LWDNEVEDALQKLDDLTQDEARMIAAQTLGIVNGLAGNVRVIAEGTQHLHDLLLIFF
jgi:hypothetical protein